MDVERWKGFATIGQEADVDLAVGTCYARNVEAEAGVGTGCANVLGAGCPECRARGGAGVAGVETK